MTELKGTLTGTSRINIINQARDIAAQYFSTRCLNIELHRERADTEYVHENMFQPPTAAGTTFTADFTATIEHKWTDPTYGLPECRDCKLTKLTR